MIWIIFCLNFALLFWDLFHFSNFSLQIDLIQSLRKLFSLPSIPLLAHSCEGSPGRSNTFSPSKPPFSLAIPHPISKPGETRRQGPKPTYIKLVLPCDYLVSFLVDEVIFFLDICNGCIEISRCYATFRSSVHNRV